MRLYEIAELIEREFPLEDAYEWDNCGLLLGDRNRDIKTVLLSLDVTPSVLEEAKNCGAELILSHHPILFGGAKRITSDTAEGKTVMSLLENKIAVYAAHTNCDVGKNGINARLAELFGLCGAEPLEENGLGRIGNLEKPLTLLEFAESTKLILNTPFVRICGDKTATLSRVAVASGACADSIPRAAEKGAEVIVTADMKYHEMLDYSELGIAIIDAGHYPTENIVKDIFYGILKDTGLTLVKSANPDIFQLV